MCNAYTDVQAPSNSSTLSTASVCSKVANLKPEGRGKQIDRVPPGSMLRMETSFHGDRKMGFLKPVMGESLRVSSVFLFPW